MRMLSMNELTSWLDTLQSSLSRIIELILHYIPQILAALLLIFIGWLAAALLRGITTRAIISIDWVLPRILPGKLGRQMQRVLQPRLFGGIVFWIVILTFVAIATQVLGLSLLSSWLDAFLTRLPQMLLAALVLLGSVVVSQLAREATARAAGVAGLEYQQLLGYAVQATILITAGVIALDLLGLDITFLVLLAGILLGAIAGGAALAFGLGAQTTVSNLLGMRNIVNHLHSGDTIHIDGIEGQIVQIDRRGVILETPDGRVMVPGKLFSEHSYVILMRETPHG